MRAQTSQIVHNIQFLRAISALFVVYAHIADSRYHEGLSIDIGACGSVGVSLFFVISGFVISHTTQSTATNPHDFIINRFIRIFPIYWMATMATFLAMVMMPQVFKTPTPDLEALIKSLLFIPFRKDNGLLQPVVYVGWTLNYEMYFYALFAATLSIGQRWIRLSVLTMALSSVCLLGLNLEGSDILEFYANPIVFAFLYGCVLGALWNRLPIWKGRLAQWLLFLAAALSVIGQVATYAWLNGTFGQMAATFPSALTVLFALLMERAGQKARADGLAMTLGAASYSLYLIHPFVVQAGQLLFRKLLVIDTGAEYMATGAALILASCLASLWLYRYVEAPVHQTLRRGILRGAEVRWTVFRSTGFRASAARRSPR